MSVLTQVICRMAIFMLCARTIIHFRPDKAYEKYLKLLAGAMVLLQLLIQAESMFGNKSTADLEKEVRLFSENLEEGLTSGEGMKFPDSGELLDEIERVQSELMDETLQEIEAVEKDRTEEKDRAGEKDHAEAGKDGLTTDHAEGQGQGTTAGMSVREVEDVEIYVETK